MQVFTHLSALRGWLPLHWVPPTCKREYEKALEQLQVSSLDFAKLDIAGRLAEDYAALDRFDEAKAVAERAFAQKLDGPGIHQLLLQIAYIQDDQTAQRRKRFNGFAGRRKISRVSTYKPSMP